MGKPDILKTAGHWLLPAIACLALLLGSRLPASSFDLLLDPGHGPDAPGAISCAGVPEYRYNNDLAAFLVAGLQQAGVTVTLSKAPESSVPLRDRVKQSAGTDLVLSLHHDSVQPQFLTRQPSGSCSSKASGFSLFVSRTNPFFDRSLAYARQLGTSLVAQGLHPALHHAEAIPGENRLLLDPQLGIYAFDALVVLQSARAPAVLLEAGVIVNPADENLIRSPAFREKVLTAIGRLIATGAAR
jgi:N-acetylmuramoyl-L-alanine amidase